MSAPRWNLAIVAVGSGRRHLSRIVGRCRVPRADQVVAALRQGTVRSSQTSSAVVVIQIRWRRSALSLICVIALGNRRASSSSAEAVPWARKTVPQDDHHRAPPSAEVDEFEGYVDPWPLFGVWMAQA